jgi:DNA-binding transcriptional regulator YdaS (Cro superfamily)
VFLDKFLALWQRHGMTLNEYLAKEQLGLSAFASRLGVESSTVHRWVHGTRRPSLACLLKIERITGGRVKAKDFFVEIAE